MNRPRNNYTPGQPLPTPLHAVGRPVTFYHAGLIEAGLIEAGQISQVEHDPDGDLIYSVRVVSGGTFRQVKLGDLNNPQPNTFTYAP